MYIDGYRYKPGALESSSLAFITIATAMPKYDLDELCDNLARSSRLAEGASLHPSHVEGAKKIDGELKECSLVKLRDEAGEFCRCVGAFQGA